MHQIKLYPILRSVTSCQLVMVIIILILLFSCNASRRSNKSVEMAMQHYDRLILKLDADSIALLFTPAGNLGNIATGRDSIRKFLASFKNIQVLYQASATESIKINKDTAIQKGSYHQTDVIAGKDTVKVKGTYTATWWWLPKEGWRIQQMSTQPSN